MGIISGGGICYSGGARGADEVFGEEAIKAGHTVHHWTFPGYRSCDPKNSLILAQESLNLADVELKKANEVLKRTFPSGKEYVDNLLRRNYFQALFGHTIYAVTELAPNKLPFGGTAWAVVMGMNMNKTLYVFDQAYQLWYTHIGDKLEVISENSVPRPSGFYAGIGTRNLSPIGEQAIRDLYK